jgi:hypothetical protein
MSRLIAACAVALSLSTVAAPAQEIEWRQVLDLPVGLNLPAGGPVPDILGLAPGDSYADARAKLIALGPPNALERPQLTFEQRMSGVVSDAPYTENWMAIYLPLGGGSQIEASYASRLRIVRDPTARIRDVVEVDVSAPSSGQQAFYIYRHITYEREADQPRISETLAEMNRKLGGNATATRLGQTHNYRWQYDDGRLLAAADPNCNARATAETEESRIAGINPDGTCDVVVTMSATPGLSDDHAWQLRFSIGDNERGRQNLTADYGYFWDYVKEVQSRAGARPAL